MDVGVKSKTETKELNSVNGYIKIKCKRNKKSIKTTKSDGVRDAKR